MTTGGCLPDDGSPRSTAIRGRTASITHGAPCVAERNSGTGTEERGKMARPGRALSSYLDISAATSRRGDHMTRHTGQRRLVAKAEALFGLPITRSVMFGTWQRKK